MRSTDRNVAPCHVCWCAAQEEKNITQNTVDLVPVLYNMCKVELVLKSTDQSGVNKINKEKIDETLQDMEDFLKEWYGTL